ncbi:ABC transporter permease [Nocardioides piscis]|uniref:Transport permease protein n=1 Tax=Nocardioides piscis TaxID=2714938 RepID=A0A6G7YIA0_9ACTN|nr:ABC transporter permease [Nocardioides piscis]QIK76542.1 ABC transporter permease [Nocardioides piscis]
MTALVTRARAPFARRTDERRPTSLRLFTDQLGYALRDLWRSRIALVFTFAFPLTFLVVMGALVGNDTVSADSPVRVMQFVTPSAAVMGALYGAFPTIAASLADARERGILKRVHGTPLPLWIHLGARTTAAVVFALGSLASMLLVGVVAYDVQIQWDTFAATAVTVLAAVTCFAVAGVAVAGLARSATAAQAVSIALAVLLSFVSGVTAYGEMPGWADRIARVFPLKALNDSLQEQFDPFASGAGWDLRALAVIGAWVAGAAVVARLTFRWDAPEGRARRRTRHGVVARSTLVARPLGHVASRVVGRPGWLSLVGDQTRWATQSALRDAGWVFFAIAMPVGLYAFNASLMGGSGVAEPDLGLQAAAGMIAWSVVVTVVVNIPEAVARARERGILKRLHGTPLQIQTYFAGRLVSALGLVLVTAALILVSGVLWFDLRVAWGGLPLAAGVLVLGTASLAACGLLLASVLPSSKAVTAVGLGIILPLAFFSDVFVFGVVPDWMETVGSFFPLKHLANSVADALAPAGPTVSWVSLVVMSAWLTGAGMLARRLFRWSSEP